MPERAGICISSKLEAAFVGIAYHSNWESSYTDPLAAEGGIQPGQPPAPVEILMPGAERSSEEHLMGSSAQSNSRTLALCM